MGYDFKKAATAKISNRSQRLEPGDYVVEIKKCTAFEARDKTNYFTADFTVLESTNEKVPVGVERGWMQDLDVDAGPGALKGFVLAALGLDHKNSAHASEIDKLEADADKFNAICTEMIDDPKDPACKNGFAGTKMRINVTMTKTKEDKDFSKHSFAPYTESAPAEKK